MMGGLLGGGGDDCLLPVRDVHHFEKTYIFKPNPPIHPSYLEMTPHKF